MTRRRSRRATWAPLMVVAPASLAFLAAATIWVNGNDPRVATEPVSAAASTGTQQSVPVAGAAPGFAGQDAATELRLARLEELLRLTKAQALILDQIAAAPLPAPAEDPATPAAQAAAANQDQPRPVTASRAPAAQAPAAKAPAAKAPAAKAPAAQAPAAKAPAAQAPAPAAKAPAPAPAAQAPAPAANTVTGASGA